MLQFKCDICGKTNSEVHVNENVPIIRRNPIICNIDFGYEIETINNNEPIYQISMLDLCDNCVEKILYSLENIKF